MTAPRLEIRLDRLEHNTRTLVGRLGARGITVCAVTKATLGSPEIARVLLAGGATSLGESRIENVEALRRGGIEADIMHVRAPMLSQVDRVVEHATSSLNSEIETVAALAAAASQRGVRHRVVVMVELGDLREGVMIEDVPAFVDRVLEFPGIELAGIGTNLACQSGVIPDAANMAELAVVAKQIEARIGHPLAVVSGGNSSNLRWALDPDEEVGAVNHLRLGESVLLGLEPTRRRVIEGLFTDAFCLVAEVIEVKQKPATPWGERGEMAFGLPRSISTSTESFDPGTDPLPYRVIAAIGQQDIDPDGLIAPQGLRIIGASSDHLVLAPTADGPPPVVGSEIRFGVNYSALLRAMTSPHVARSFVGAGTTGPCDRFS